MQTPRDHRLDVAGLLCPVPVLMTARAIADLAFGEVLEVVGTDLEMLRDIPAWCEQSGNRLLEIDARQGRIRCRIERAAVPRMAPLS